MKTLWAVAPGRVEVRDAPMPEVGPTDVLVRIRACGICGTDLMFIGAGGLPVDGGIPIPLGHEPAGEVARVGERVTELPVGARVVLNPMAPVDGVLGNGGSQGGLSEYVVIRDARLGRDLERVPDDLDFAVAALNEPMAVARHVVSRGAASASDRVVVFGAGAIGLGAVLWLRQIGAGSIVVVDVSRDRLATASAVGADATVDASSEDVAARLIELHGEGRNGIGMLRAGTDLYIDAAGASSALETAIGSAKLGARLVMAGTHERPELVDTSQVVMSELTWTGSMGYPTEIFEVTATIADRAEEFGRIISDRVDFGSVTDAVELALERRAIGKVVVTFGD